MGRIIGLESVEKIVREFYNTEFPDLVDAGWTLIGGHFSVDRDAKMIHYCYTDNLDFNQPILQEWRDNVGEDAYAVDVFVLSFIETLMEARYYNVHKGEIIDPRFAKLMALYGTHEFPQEKIMNLMLTLTDPLLYMLKENEIL